MAEQQQQETSPTISHAEAVSPGLRSHKLSGTPLNPDEATKMLNEEHITRLTEDAVRKLALYTRNELEGIYIYIFYKLTYLYI